MRRRTGSAHTARMDISAAIEAATTRVVAHLWADAPRGPFGSTTDPAGKDALVAQVARVEHAWDDIGPSGDYGYGGEWHETHEHCSYFTLYGHDEQELGRHCVDWSQTPPHEFADRVAAETARLVLREVARQGERADALAAAPGAATGDGDRPRERGL